MTPKAGRAKLERLARQLDERSIRSRVAVATTFRIESIVLPEKDKLLRRQRFVQPRREWPNENCGSRLECSQQVAKMAANMVSDRIPDRSRTEWVGDRRSEEQ